MWDRGGAPLHFVSRHVALALDSSPEALRWLSVVFALADDPALLGPGQAARRAGRWRATAALVASASAVLALYGTVGRMYALLRLRQRALCRPLRPRARAEDAAGRASPPPWRPCSCPAVHPYGAIVVAAEAVVALAVWRGRPLRPALPVLAVGLLLLPFVVADLRLADRFTVGVGGEESLAAPGDAWSQLWRALQSFAGRRRAGRSPSSSSLGIAGTAILLRTRTAFAAFGLLALVAPPVLFILLRTGSVDGPLPAAPVFALPLWAAAIGVGVARLTRGLHPALAVAGWRSSSPWSRALAFRGRP